MGESKPDAGPVVQPGAVRGRRVLVVEDEYLLAADLAEALSGLGAEVVGPVGFVSDA